MTAKVLSGVVAALLLGGCTITPSGEQSQSQLRAQWDGQNVYPAGFKQDVVAFLGTYLNNPRGIRDAGVTTPELKRVAGDPGDRYMVCLRYNARGSDGRYDGVKEVIVTFVDGKLERFIDPQRGDQSLEAAARQIRATCRDAAYAAFPELQNLKR